MDKIIEVQNLVKKFGDFCAVNQVSFTVTKGQIFAFLGPNGAGKTTIIKILTTILKPTEGAISIDGYNPLTEQHQVRSTFGIIFQDSTLDNEMTALENMELHCVLYGVPKKDCKQKIENLLRLVELWDRKKDFVKNFSGGMKRRLEIARALLHEPKNLLMDEPTLGLDPQTRNHIWNYIQNLNKENELTVFFTTHYMEEAERIANEIAIIDQGKIIASGTPDKLKEETQSPSLEDAFIALTGHNIREEEGSNLDRMRNLHKMWRGGR